MPERKRHPILTLVLVIDLMFAWGVVFATVLALEYLSWSIENWVPALLAASAIFVDAIAWQGIRWALLLRAGGAFIFAMLVVRIDAEQAPVITVVLVQQMLVAPACLLAGWLGK